jgi:hypothetical protein
MRTLVPLALLATLLLTACNQARSPETVAADTASAQQKAQDSNAETQQSANEKMAQANADVNKAQADAEHVNAVQEEKVAETDAKGAYDVAMARCEGLSGSDQRACKDQAKAAYDTALAQAKQTKANADPQH